MYKVLIGISKNVINTDFQGTQTRVPGAYYFCAYYICAYIISRHKLRGNTTQQPHAKLTHQDLRGKSLMKI